MASESHSSGVKIDRWLPSLHCGLLKLALWCDYRTHLACAPGGKVDLWSYSSLKSQILENEPVWGRQLEAAFAAQGWLSNQFNWPALPRILFFFWLKQMTFKPFFFPLTISRGHLVFCEFRWEPRILPLLGLPSEECAQSTPSEEIRDHYPNWGACPSPFSLMHSSNSFTRSFGQQL